MAVCSVQSLDSRVPLYLLPTDIRFFNEQKILIDSDQKLSEFEDLVRYQHVITEHYSVIGKHVITSSGKKLGKVRDFLFDPSHYFLTKLVISPPLLRKFLVASLLIDRNDIIETKKNHIIVKENLAKIKKASPSVLPLQS
jgi:sporulation protein YlmC with PRC-barrel domain